jgi:hypothetical protein
LKTEAFRLNLFAKVTPPPRKATIATCAFLCFPFLCASHHRQRHAQDTALSYYGLFPLRKSKTLPKPSTSHRSSSSPRFARWKTKSSRDGTMANPLEPVSKSLRAGTERVHDQSRATPDKKTGRSSSTVAPEAPRRPFSAGTPPPLPQ